MTDERYISDKHYKEAGEAWRDALRELSNTPRLAQRHVKVARKLIAQAEACSPKQVDKQLDLEQRAARHLCCAGIPSIHLNAVLALLDD
jgi:hypothetical protein